MKAAIRSILSPDVDLDKPLVEDPQDFTILLQVIVGPDGGEGEESIQILVCTPKSLSRRIKAERFVVGRSLLIVEDFDLPFILETVRQLVEGLRADTWAQMASKLERLGIYEFEDA